MDILLRGATEDHKFHTSRALEYASARGYDEMLHPLLMRMKESNTLLSSQLEKLMCGAAELGYVSQVALLHNEYHVSVEVVPDGVSPLQYAAQNGPLELVQYLLEVAKADPNSDAGTETDAPLLLAAERGYELIVRHLLSSRADTNRVKKDNTNRTHLFLAAENGHEAIINYLLSPSQIKRHQGVRDIPNFTSHSPVAISCIRGHDGIVKMLLDAGANPTTLDSAQHTALYHAVESGNEPLAELRRRCTPQCGGARA